MRSLDVHANPSLRAAVALLQAAGLPSSDLTEAHLEHFLYCGPAEAPTGMVGLEIFGHDALIRSLAVIPSAQHGGLGTALVEHVEAQARRQGVGALYLLTTSAQRFFEQRGYRATSRESCPASIRSTSEFANVCPASAALLMKTLG